jgi:glycosyltransferase involved in cell wall biosynthesis
VKVAFQADQLWFEAPGGIGTYVRELAPLIARSEDFTLFHCRFDRGGPDPAWLERFRTLEVPGPIRTLYPQWDLLGRPKLPPSFRDFDIVHATNPVGVPPVHRGSRLVVTVHDLAHHRFPDRIPTKWRFLYGAGVRAAVKRGAALLAPSRATAEDLVKLAGADPAVVHVTPLAASLPASAADPAEVLSRLGITAPYLLFVGTLEPRKNVVTLVRAYRQVAPDMPHSLVLAGPDGWHTQDLDDELARDAPGTVVRTGRVSEADLDALYRGSSAFAYPSSFEGFGLPVLEAMARGVPVVTSDTPALAEVAGDAALMVGPEDVAGLAEALARVLTDPALAADLGSRGRERAAGYSWGATAQATLEAYRFATGASRP